MRFLLLRLLYLCSVYKKKKKRTLPVCHSFLEGNSPMNGLTLAISENAVHSCHKPNRLLYFILFYFTYHNMISNIWDICSLITYFLSILLVDPENKEVGLPCTCLANNWLLISILIIILIIMESLIFSWSPTIRDSTKMIQRQLKEAP